MQTDWIEQEEHYEWHPPEMEYYKYGGHNELLEFFMDRNWTFNALPRPTVPKIYRGVIVSIAGSGNQPWEDRLFNISLLGFNCDKHGYLYQFVFNMDEWEDPRRDIPEFQLEFMDINEVKYHKKKFSEQYINQLVNTADFVVMYDARRRRRILEARFPIFKTKPFVCLKHDIEWRLIRGVPPETRTLEYYAFKQGRNAMIRRPAKEVLLIGWLLTLPNPTLRGLSEFWLEQPSLLKEITDFALAEYARIYIDRSTITETRVLERDGFKLDATTNVYYLDTYMELRYPMIQRIRKLHYDGQNQPIAWMPILGTSLFPYGRNIVIPPEDERIAAISKLPTSTLLHVVTDFSVAVPHSRYVHRIFEQVGASPPALAHISEDLHF